MMWDLSRFNKKMKNVYGYEKITSKLSELDGIVKNKFGGTIDGIVKNKFDKLLLVQKL
ncbi:hypothetical protein FACS1894198_6950 [Clostridia bacterium]|nr:hypothetical protein FACS1894198_6950 [Clostridia bacterium]